jgi:hypothetical protein
MRWAQGGTHLVVVAGMLVGIAHDEANGTACGLSFKNTTEQLYTISLLAAGSDAALSWSTTIQLLLDEVDVYVNAWRHTINDAANGFSVAFAKRCQSE